MMYSTVCAEKALQNYEQVQELTLLRVITTGTC